MLNALPGRLGSAVGNLREALLAPALNYAQQQSRFARIAVLLYTSVRQRGSQFVRGPSL